MIRLLAGLLTVAAINVSMAADYDVLIRNGNVYDGTGAPPYVADIAISGDRVSAIGDFAGRSAER